MKPLHFKVILAALIGVGVVLFAATILHSMNWIVITALGVVLVLVVIYYSWVYMKSVYDLLERTKAIDGVEFQRSYWRMDVLGLLKERVELFIKKYETAAAAIEKLSESEAALSINPIIKEDAVGRALEKMHVELAALKEEESRRHWVAQSLAKFGEVLRTKADMKAYASNIIVSLARTLNANQGALYVEYQDQQQGRYMEMEACYAYDRKKHVSNRVTPGQGLIGQCMLERDMIILKEVPANFVRITSGLGEATPRYVIIAPLMLNEMFYGVIEFASFHVFQEHELEFLKRACIGIAGELSSMNNIQATQRLLEESKTLTAELQEREEAMQVNLEKLTLSQQAMAQKQSELNSYLAAINNTIASAEFDMNGNFITANEIFLKIMAFSNAELKGVTYNTLMGDDSATLMMWENLKQGKFFSGEFKMRSKAGKDLWLAGTFNPISVGKGLPEKVMMFAQFITQEKEKLNDMTVLLNAFKASLPMVEFNEQFVCKTANDKFLKMFDLKRMSLKNKTIHDFIDPYFKNVFENMKGEILAKDNSTILLPIHTPHCAYTYETSVTVSHNPETNSYRIILILVKEVEDNVRVMAAV